MIKQSAKFQSSLLRELTNYHVSSSIVTCGDIDRFIEFENLLECCYSQESIAKAKSLILPNVK